MKTTLTYKESKHLKELGVDPKLASVCADDVPENEKPSWDAPNMIEILESQLVYSLDDLLSILPKKITDRRGVYNLTIGVNSEDLWYAKYLNDHECWDSLNSYQDAHELCDCIYDMIVWLKTEKAEMVWL